MPLYTPPDFRPVLGRAASMGAPGGANDDEFEASSLASAWVSSEGSGTSAGTWTQRYGKLTFRNTAQPSSNHMAMITKPATVSIGDIIECHVYNQSTLDFTGSTLLFSNGHTSAAKYAGIVLYGMHLARIEGGTDLSTAASTGASVNPTPSTQCPVEMYLRAKYVAANTWGAYYSFDGFTWNTITTAFAFTMTPTEIGFGMQFQTSQVAVQSWHSFRYIRFNPGDEA